MVLSPHAFVDTYYNWDANRPPSQMRSHTTQAPQHDHAALNLAMAGLRTEGAATRGALTLQTGDSVDANYVAETKRGVDVKHVQEAYAGMKLGKTWVDAGIYLGHIGNESWISRDNWTYTRSMQLDYVPYYAAGVRVVGEDWQFHFMNGWQNINENNAGKALGVQRSWRQAKGQWVYNNQVGHEPFPGRRTSGLRTYQNLHYERLGAAIDWKGAVDIGTQNVPGEKKALVWAATSSQWRHRWSECWTLAGRVEYFHDARGAITPVAGGFRVMGTSLNVDYLAPHAVLLRLEARHLASPKAIYPGHRRQSPEDTFVVFSAGLSL